MHALFVHSSDMRHTVALLFLLLTIAAATTTSLNGNSSSLAATPALSTSTIAFPLSTPSDSYPHPGPQYGPNFIGPGDPSITWSNGWKPQDSPCRTPFGANETTSPNQWMTYMVPINASPISLDISSDNASFSILIDNQEQLVVSNTPQSCLPQQIVPFGTNVSFITIYVNGSNNAAEGNWSFQFNNFIIWSAYLGKQSAGKTELGSGAIVSAVSVLLLSVMSFV